MNIIIPLLPSLSSPSPPPSHPASSSGSPLSLPHVVGRPLLFWLLDHLTDVHSTDAVYLCTLHSLDAHHRLLARLRSAYPTLPLHPVLLTFHPRTPAESLLSIIQSIDPSSLTRRTLLLNPHTIYHTPLLPTLRCLPPSQHACILTPTPTPSKPTAPLPIAFHPNTDGTIHPSATVDPSASPYASTGAFAFASATALHQRLTRMVDEGVSGDVWDVVKRLHADGEPVCGLCVPAADVACIDPSAHLSELVQQLRLTPPSSLVPTLATSPSSSPHPSQSLSASSPISSSPRLNGTVPLPPSSPSHRLRFCFELDGTLLTLPHPPSSYATSTPILPTIRLLQSLHSAGHHITIHTSRPHTDAVAEATRRTLEAAGVEWDELVWGKPAADVYVDDRAVRSGGGGVGGGWGGGVGEEWSKAGNRGVDDRPSAEGGGRGGAAVQSGFIAARHFNSVVQRDAMVVKSAATSSIRGEVFFYRHIPPDLVDLFPTLHRVEEHRVHFDASQPAPVASGGPTSPSSMPLVSSVSTLYIDKIDGVTFSHLLVNRAITPGRLVKLLTAIHRVHHSPGLPRPSSSTPLPSIYANYTSKLVRRYHDNLSLYTAVEAASPPSLLSSSDLLSHLTRLLSAYQSDSRGRPSPCIHGDPVFSNALLTHDERVVLLDMRGSLGGELTTAGDQLYDLAKVFQSVDGYDFILLGVHREEVDVQLCERLKEAYEAFVRGRYEGVRLRDVQLITASFYFSMLPLHDNAHHQTLFYQRARHLLANLLDDNPHPADVGG